MYKDLYVSAQIDSNNDQDRRQERGRETREKIPKILRNKHATDLLLLEFYTTSQNKNKDFKSKTNIKF